MSRTALLAALLVVLAGCSGLAPAADGDATATVTPTTVSESCTADPPTPPSTVDADAAASFAADHHEWAVLHQVCEHETSLYGPTASDRVSVDAVADGVAYVHVVEAYSYSGDGVEADAVDAAVYAVRNGSFDRIGPESLSRRTVVVERADDATQDDRKQLRLRVGNFAEDDATVTLSLARLDENGTAAGDGDRTAVRSHEVRVEAGSALTLRTEGYRPSPGTYVLTVDAGGETTRSTVEFSGIHRRPVTVYLGADGAVHVGRAEPRQQQATDDR